MWDNITFTAVLLMLAFVTATIAPATVSGALVPSAVATSGASMLPAPTASSTMI
ncbi:hypothetical protein LMG33818_001239 [Halomonadaceae bacterium LMG 33818]|uniref:hypothetical protein n=1 Tax=Cernens ardua TaxID=3402176 RepID=UPI003EDBEEDE